jgi:hypothetical protein
MVMELVGAAASVTGILAFAGQAISGVSKVVTFFNGMKKARKKTEMLVKDLSSLKETLENVNVLLKFLESDEQQYSPISILFVIGKPVEDCTIDIAEMEKVVEEFSLGANSFKLTSLSKRTEIALEQLPSDEIRQKILLHYQRINGSIALFNKYINFHSLRKSHLRLLSDTS